MTQNIYEVLGLNLLEKDGVFPSLFIGETKKIGEGRKLSAHTPINSQKNSIFREVSTIQVNDVMKKLNVSFDTWKMVPAPKRGELIRVVSNLARENKNELAHLITLESGKIYEEAKGEVQEFIDVCDFAVGLSRQLYGLTIASERYKHKMIEQWHPLGTVGIISAFNFPMAVWAWNAMIALVCGNTIVWKPSIQTPLCAVACHLLLQKALEQFPEFPQDISSVIVGTRAIGEVIVKSKRAQLISATGSVSMGRKIAAIVSARLGKLLLELGGNNAMIVTPSANLDLTLRATLFSAVGTAGQRCTSLRRLFVHKEIKEQMLKSLINAYKSVKIGDPFDKNILMGPLINEDSYKKMMIALKQITKQGGKILFGGKQVHKNVPEGGFYVEPTLVEIKHGALILQHETFAPILYVIEYEKLEDAIQMNNSVPQGLSSAIFTQDLNEAETFTSALGSDCGIVNVNIGTSGAEIGGAFGGEKDTGGGRESGSDSWKSYMRRSTNTINFSGEIPLSQGIEFEIK